MKLGVTGARGQLGRAVVDEAAARGHECVAAAHDEVAVEDAGAVASWIASGKPDAIVHCAAWTDVDGCERDPDRAMRINGTGTGHLATACLEHGCKLIYVSTDFVFAGDSTRPYRPEDPPAPVSAYGASKLAGERALPDADGFCTVRTSWVFGPGGKNFPRAILDRAQIGQALTVVDDQRGCPTLTRDLADALVDLAELERPRGIYHACNDGECTWYEFAREIVAAAALDVPVEPMSSTELDRPARRPAYSVLDCSRLAQLRSRPMPDYRDALGRYLREELS